MSKNKKTVIVLLIAAVLIAVIPLFVKRGRSSADRMTREV